MQYICYSTGALVMIDRIRELLSVRQLTPTQFADTIGVARPIVSHILSGRNKPSLEVVQRIVAAFPDLSLPWLLSGTGAMMAPETAADAPSGPATASDNQRVGKKASETTRAALNKISTPAAPAGTASPAAVPSETLFDGIAASALAPSSEATQLADARLAQNRSAATISLVEPSTTTRVIVPRGDTTTDAVASESVVGANHPPLSDSGRAASSPATLAQPPVQPIKTIRRIVIFYQDGTFSDYQPESE